MRCDSIGDLYPIISTNSYQASYPSTFATITTILWHNKLGHPGPSVSRSLRKNKFICYENVSSSIICESCVFRKHVKLSFYASSSNTFMPFEIIHSDLWTSPILSNAWHKYYILFLDDYSNLLWTLPISKKSQAYLIFSSLSVFNVTMGKSSTMSLSKNFATKMVLFFNFHAFTLLQKMEKLNEKYEP